MLYRTIRPLLFMLDPEVAHYLTLNSLALLTKCHLIRAPKSTPKQAVKVMGLSFVNRIGLAAGLDKNGEYIDPLSKLGFGFIEVGTVTPQPQEGNPRPRLFRLRKEEALINRMGFNNKGLDALVHQVQKRCWQGCLGINIGKNKHTPNEHAANDYLAGMKAVYPFADYITINISSPNTPDLRALQGEKPLMQLLELMKVTQGNLHQQHQRYVPLVVKIAPDLTTQEIITIAKAVLEVGIDGVIATNTTIARPLKYSYGVDIQGGLSGAPLLMQSTDTLKKLTDQLQGKVAVIASGGVMSKKDVQLKLSSGADLVQLYTGLIYKGPALIKNVLS